MSQYTIDLGTPNELHLHDRDADSCVQIAPFRGGLIKRFRVQRREVLYLDEETFADKEKNVRGGIPILFPSPGRLTGDTFAIDGAKGTLPQHGFLRQHEFRVVELDADKGIVRLVAEWPASEAYPWAGMLSLRVALQGSLLRVETMITNREDRPMPFALGFHPYFSIAETSKADLSVAHHAEQAFDNVVKRTMRIEKNLDFTVKELDLHLLDHPSSSMSMFKKDKLFATVRASEEFGMWVLWTLRGKDFVCVEPWTAGANALNTDERVLRIPAGATRRLWIEIEAAS